MFVLSKLLLKFRAFFRVVILSLLLILPVFAFQIDFSYAATTTAQKNQKKIVSNNKHKQTYKHKHKQTYKPVQTSLVVDGKTGKILHAQNENTKIYPASLTKVMTLYLLFEALDSGKLSLHDSLHVSKKASASLPCKLNLKAGEKITVKEAILGLIVKSANDAAVTVAENMAGSEQKFAKLMTLRAKTLGMKNTIFTNASGWHDPRQMTTAIDLAKLSIAIRRDFPQYYGFFAKTNFNFRGKQVNGHNSLTANYPGAEGLKTGFTNPAGRNLITTATRNGRTLVGIVTGSHSRTHRDTKMANLLDEHFGVSKKLVTTKSMGSKPNSKKAKSSKIKLASSKR